MPRWFNTAGPCNPADHYMLPGRDRLPDVCRLVERKAYFVLHAPRQVGKTTALLGLAGELTVEGHYCAVLLSMEVGARFGDDPGAAEHAILEDWRRDIENVLPEGLRPSPWPEAAPGSRIGAALASWAAACPRPLVVFLDEIDALRDEALISVLRQLRSGHRRRPQGFPWSLGLIGMRDVRDYLVASGGSGRMGTSSPFNVKTESLTMRMFHRDEVTALYAQHAADTGQSFEPAAVDRAFELTQGQPWLVNALARQAVEVLVPDRERPVTVADIDEAKDVLIRRQDTHLDRLAERLREPRVRAVMEPLLAGGAMEDVPEDDRQYVLDLGLVRRGKGGGFEVANPIYREVVPRALASGAADSMPALQPTWLGADGKLDARRLRESFLEFWRQHGEALRRTAPYPEIAPHLVLMAYLHRVVNAGGTIDREYAIGSGRMDLCVRYRGLVLGIELKAWRDGDRRNPVVDGLSQLDAYLAGLGLATGWLVVFDERSGQSPLPDRTRAESATTPGGRSVTLVWA